MRAIWLPPDEWDRLERARKALKKSRAEYAKEAIRGKVNRDLAPQLPDLDDVRDRMSDLPDDVQRQVLDLMAAILTARTRPA